MHEVAGWIAAVPTLIGFGLALGLSPALYGATADILARNQNVRARMTWLLTGLASGATALALVLHGVNPANLVYHVRQRGDAVVENRDVDLVVGVLLLILACAMVLWVRVAPTLPRRPERAPDQSSPPAALFVLGFTSAVIGLTTLPIMYLTGRLVESVSTDPVVRVCAYLVFLVALLGPFILLAWLWSRFPVATRKVTAAYERMLGWDTRWVAFGVMMVGGVALVGFATLPQR